jgi:circadian clock protein KaiC
MTDDRRVRTGVEGLDAVLGGGLPAERAYMLRGGPGTGKTILGLHFLTAGTDTSETALGVQFEEQTENLVSNAEGVGLDVSGVEFIDLSPEAEFFAADRSYGVFEPDEVEGPDVFEAVREAIGRTEPDRLFVDPLTSLRRLTSGDYQFRRTVASLVRYATDRGATVLFSTQPSPAAPDDDLEFLSDGSIELARAPKGRTIEVRKLRGSKFEDGEHTLRITDEGMRVYPILLPGEYRRSFDAETVSSGVDEVDALLGGGIERGTITLVTGPSGVGKTTLSTHFLEEAAARGERSVAYLFEESTDTFVHRSEAIDLPVGEMREAGTLAIEAVEPLTVSPDEFADAVRREVEQRDARLVTIDGVSGYRLSIRGDEADLVRELHALCRYLRNMGVTVLLVDAVSSVTGEFQPTSANISYLGDNVVFLRYVARGDTIGRAIGVLKKRASDFERTIREFEITDDGLVVREPVNELRDVLQGVSKGD